MTSELRQVFECLDNGTPEKLGMILSRWVSRSRLSIDNNGETYRRRFV